MRPLDSLRETLRHDGKFWRWAAYMGSVHLPEWWRRHSPPWFGSAFFLGLGEQRRAVIDNLRRIRGPRGAVADAIDAWRTFVAFSRCLTDSLETTLPNPPRYFVTVDGRGALEEQLKNGAGAILLTAHLGSFEVVARVLAGKGEAPVSVVMAREANPSTRAFVEHIRGRGGVNVIYADESELSVLGMLRALRKGHLLAIQLDRPLDPSGKSVRQVPLFGEESPFPLGPFRLAQAAKVPILPAFALRRGHRRYRVQIDPPIWVRGRDEASAVEALHAAVARLEAAIRAEPLQWFQFSPMARNGNGRPAEPTGV